MTNENENFDSLNEETTAGAETVFDTGTIDIDALKEKYTQIEEKNKKLEESNRQLFVRAKKGEGFELKDGHWIKKESKSEKPMSEKSEKSEKSSDLDYGQKALLRTEGIKSKDEQDLVREYMENTGKDIEDILENKYFQNDLKDIREQKATREAIPMSSGRSSPGTKDTVEYWLAKGELPPTDQVQLRRDVLNARVEREKNQEKFTSNPIIGHI